jgi:hypothetical protein
MGCIFRDAAGVARRLRVEFVDQVDAGNPATRHRTDRAGRRRSRRNPCPNEIAP